DRPAVRAVAALVAPAVREESSAVAEVQRLSRLAYRLTDRPGESDPDAVERLQAIADLAAAQRRAALAQAEGLRRRRAWEGIREAEQAALDRERIPGRRALMAAFYEQAEQLREIVRRVAAYDAETVRLGGHKPEVFWAELGDSEPTMT